MKPIVISICLFLATASYAQHDFVNQCEGAWTGTMDIFSQGTKAADGPMVTFTVTPLVKDSIWSWRTDYESKKYGVLSKEYTLIAKDPEKGTYLLDEGDGVVLNYQLSGSKMYSVFEVQDLVLVATYALKQDQLLFEVYSSSKSKDTTGVLSHPVQNVQRVTLSRKL